MEPGDPVEASRPRSAMGRRFPAIYLGEGKTMRYRDPSDGSIVEIPHARVRYEEDGLEAEVDVAWVRPRTE
jgi:hypothetical protein